MALPFDVKYNIIWRRVETAKKIISDVAASRRSLAQLCGGSGIGKTFLLRQTCRRHLIRIVPEDRPATAEALVTMTWQNRHHPVHHLNECDALFRNEQCLDILKIMHEEPRRCAHYTVEAKRNEENKARGSKAYRESIAPTQFDLGNNARQVFCSNLNYTDPAITSQLPVDHWRALIRRGLDPVWIPIAGNEGRDLFEFTVWLAGEGRMLRDLQFDYPTSRDAVAFYVQNIQRLMDISPARLTMIAEVIRDTPDKGDRADQLERMLADTDQRPKLTLEPSQVQVLLWPRKPPRKVRPAPRQKAPPRFNIDDMPEPPEPPPVARTPVSAPEPEPEPSPALAIRLLPPPEVLGWSETISAIYSLTVGETTLERVRCILARTELSEFEDNEFCAEFAQRMEGAARWTGDHYDMACSFAHHGNVQPIFVTEEGVLFYMNGALHILAWEQVRHAIAPQLEDDRKKRERQRMQNRARELAHSKLPPKRKLKVVKEVLAELRSMPDVTITDHVALDFIDAMTTDDPAFADCKLFDAYLRRAKEQVEAGIQPAVKASPSL